MTIPRGEYPRPQFVRDEWACLNGKWQFEIDSADSGIERGMDKRELAGSINVPFCPESELSGVKCEDFMNAVWYRREFEVPADWAGRRLLLNFQAVDYDATVWVNGVEVGRHRGGFSAFTCDITDAAKPGERAIIVVRARDDVRQNQPAGKQCKDLQMWGCFYMRTTGIWQTVWIEPVPQVHLRRPRITPDLDGKRFSIRQPLSNNVGGWRVRATALLNGEEIARAEAAADKDLMPHIELVIPAEKLRLWDIGQGNLYDIVLELIDAKGKVVDRARTYAGMRSIAIEGKKMKLNGRSIFQRLVLDQGYYPDGIMTAPSDAALRRDIELSMQAGFNGARLHQKVFEERFIYHADKMGYLLWCEFGDCGFNTMRPPCTMITQWLEIVNQYYNAPSIIGWCALNETIETVGDRITEMADLTRGLFLAAKVADPSRPVLDCSGGSHFVPESDLYDGHNYQQDAGEFRTQNAGLAENRPFNAEGARGVISIPYHGQPFMLSEFGGIWWNPKASQEEKSWGYGNKPATIDEFYARFEALCHVLLDNPNICGYCYTQLTDVYQEQNGIVYFDRTPKFDHARLHKIQSKKAAIEKT